MGQTVIKIKEKEEENGKQKKKESCIFPTACSWMLLSWNALFFYFFLVSELAAL